jgi:acetyltransferase-like isoleucine patch superfamily enzyme
VKYINIGINTSFGKQAVVNAWDEYEGDKFTPSITIGKGCNFGDFVHITSLNNIEIGNNVLTGRWVTITDNSHGTTDYDTLVIQPTKRRLYSKGAVVIGDKVWIGDKVTILPGVTIGEGAVVAANSVVAKDVPPYCVVAGVPAKVVRQC